MSRLQPLPKNHPNSFTNFMSDKFSSEEDKKGKNKYLQFTGMAFQMIVIIGGFAIGGRELDRWQVNEKPIWSIVLSLLGVFISLYLVYVQVKKLSDE